MSVEVASGSEKYASLGCDEMIERQRLYDLQVLSLRRTRESGPIQEHICPLLDCVWSVGVVIIEAETRSSTWGS